MVFNYDLLEDTFVMVKAVKEENSQMNKDEEEEDMIKVQIETSEGKKIHLLLPKVLLSRLSQLPK